MHYKLVDTKRPAEIGSWIEANGALCEIWARCACRTRVLDHVETTTYGKRISGLLLACQKRSRPSGFIRIQDLQSKPLGNFGLQPTSGRLGTGFKKHRLLVPPVFAG